MRLIGPISVTLLLWLLAPAGYLAQSNKTSSTPSIPRLINVSGTFQPANGRPIAAVEEVTLSVYAEKEGGDPLWQETQSVQVDRGGRYTVLLGASHADGVPPDVFASGEARWLGITFTGPSEAEGQRLQITSVPYALRSSDADTLGGRPASAYMLAPTEGGNTSSGAGSTATVGVALDGIVQPGTAGLIPKYVNATDLGPSPIFENNGQVGIGTTTPVDYLNVRFFNTNGGFTGYAVQNLGNNSNSYSGMLFYDQNGQLAQFQGFNNVTHEYRINNIARDGSSNFDGSINFMLGGATRIYANTSGVGIGTTTPSAELEVAAVVVGASHINTTSYSGISPLQTSSSSSAFIGRSARGTAASPTAVQTNDLLGFFGAIGYRGGFFSGDPAGVGVRATENFTSTANGSALEFLTIPAGTTLPVVRMGISAAGSVGIGTTSPAEKLQVLGDIRVGTTGTNGCLNNFSGGLIAGVCSSDERYKTQITAFPPALNSVAALQPVHYYWRAAQFPQRHFGSSRAYGLLAQDVERVLPELVVTNDDGYKAVDYSKLPLLTIQAVKELKSENDSLAAQNVALEKRIAALERAIHELQTEPRR